MVRQRRGIARTPSQLRETAVGSILAAFGTALPESVVTLVAVTTGPTEVARLRGDGAAMGGPLVLATVAYAVTGAALLVERRRRWAGLDGWSPSVWAPRSAVRF